MHIRINIPRTITDNRNSIKLISVATGQLDEGRQLLLGSGHNKDLIERYWSDWKDGDINFTLASVRDLHGLLPE